MGKILLLLSFICLATLAVGMVLFPSNPIFWLATNAASYQIIRAVLMLILLLQILTRPPRNIYFRLLAGTLALGVGGWVIEASYANHMMFLDTLSLLSTAVAIAITALEVHPVPNTHAAAATPSALLSSANAAYWLGAVATVYSPI